jgi:peroxiredoxin family protein
VTEGDSSYALAVILSSGEVERLYSALSVLVSTAADGERCAALATFRALALLMEPDLGRHAQEPDETPSLSWAGRETFGRSLAELRDTALELDNLEIWACSASVETMALSEADVAERLAGVMSTPRFLRTTASARRLIHV